MGACVHFSRSLPSNSWWQTMAGWQALSRPPAAEGGGRRPAFTGLAIQPYSATEVDGWQHKAQPGVSKPGRSTVCGANGVAVFDALPRRGRISDAILQAFDLLEIDGVDYRPLPLSRRKDRLARLLARVQVGIAINEHTDEDGAVVFLHACKMGLEGIVSKRLTAPYRSGPSRDWIKVKNPDSPAMMRAREGRW